MLRAGDKAPVFVLPDADMSLFDLSRALDTHHVVLYFYPRDNAPGCTRQAVDFTDHEDDFTRHGCVVLGVSPDDCLTHADFRDQNGLSVRLLSDEDGDVCRLYEVWQPQEACGGKRPGVRRSTFIISRGGVIRHVMHDVNPRGHVAEVYALVKELNSGNINGNHQEYCRDA
ncbi:MAG: peroxiredoxin [Zoogloea sp.]|nr:peroxiredoxin [Zoogloea sp.]